MAKRCEKCNLSSSCKNPLIFGKAPFNPKTVKIMVVQDCPTFFDDRTNSTPSGDTRAKLNYFAEKSGLNYKTTYFTSAIKCAPKELSDVKNKHLNACREYLLAEIVEYKPKLIIVMGKIAHQMLTEKTSVDSFAGHFSDFEFDYEAQVGMGKTADMKFSCKLMPTYSLAGSLRKWENDSEIIRHFKKGVDYMETGLINKTPPPKVNLILNKSGIIEFVERMREVSVATTDFETTGFSFFNDEIINAGYCSEIGKADIIYYSTYEKENIKKWNRENIDKAKEINSFVKEHKALIHKSLKTVNGFDHLKLVLHNGKFDYKFAKYNNIPFKNFHWCTLVADSLINENLKHGLNFCLERRGHDYGAYDTELWPYVNKDDGKKKSYKFAPPIVLSNYLGIDVEGDFRLYKDQIKELEKDGLTELFLETKMPALLDLCSMEYIGVKADRKLILKTSRMIQKAQNEIQSKLEEETKIEGFNSNSPQQINKYFVDNDYPLEKLKIAKTKTGYSTSAKELKKFEKFKKYSEVPRLILAAKKLSKIKGTYIDGNAKKKEGVVGGMLQYLDNYDRIHANFNIWTPRTGRYSINKPSLQVWPRPITGLPNTRNFIIPRKGWVLFEADFKALEQFIVAGLSKDMTLIKTLRSGQDIHSKNAVELGHILGIVDKSIDYNFFLDHCGKGKLKEEDIPVELYLKYNELRTRAKSIGFGLNYGKGADSFAEEFKITKIDAQEMIDAYFEIYWEMKNWRDNLIREGFKNTYITLGSGRRRRFDDAVNWLNSDYSEDVWSAKRLRSEIERQIMNFPVQGGAHEVFESGCLRFTEYVKKEKLKARKLLSIHDGIVGECPPEEVEQIRYALDNYLPTVLNKNTKYELSLGVDIGFYKDCWYGEKLKLIS